jgi:hypothetical protein
MKNYDFTKIDFKGAKDKTARELQYLKKETFDYAN